MSKVRKWFLCCENETHHDILLPDNGDVVVIGRGPITRIKDQKLSRSQVELRVDPSSQTVVIRQLGPNPSTVNGVSLRQREERSVGDGSRICLLYQDFPHILKLVARESIRSQDEVEGKPSNLTVEQPEVCTQAKSDSDDVRTRIAVKRTVRDYFGAHSDDVGKDDRGADSRGKRPKTEAAVSSSSEEEDERVRRAAENLTEMRRSLTKDRIVSATGMKRSTSLPLNQVTNGLSKFGFPKVPGDEWEKFGSLTVYTCKGSIPREKIAGFDIDWTIIGTKSGKVFPLSADDWRILYPEVLKKLRQLFEDDYKIAFFSNQKSVGDGRVNWNDFKQKILSIIAKIGVPVQVFICTGSGIHRKPAPGMWDHLVDVGNEGLSVDVGASFYVGDAAGRPANWGPGKKKKDFSAGDRLFALNNGVKFYTPEEFFLDQKVAPFSLPAFNPKALNGNTPLYSPPDAKLVSDRQEVIVMVGYPASGKSTFVAKHLVPRGYVHVTRDELGSWQKCMSVTQEYLKRGKSVVIDNTNPDVASRKRFADYARASRVACRCFCMTVSLEHARHNNKFRHLTSSEKAHHQVNDMILNAFKNKYEEPRLEEGFAEVLRINFIPKFEDEKLEKLYRMFLMEK